MSSDHDDDPLLRALRDLPRPAMDAASDSRGHDQAAAAFARTFDAARSPLVSRAFGGASRALVPVVLASVVGIYLTWAFGAASALFH